MKKIVLVVLILVSTLNIVHAQSRKSVPAEVEKVYGIPVYIYSYPTVEYEEVGDVTAVWSIVSAVMDEEASVKDKVKELVQAAKSKKKSGDISDFDAIIINPDDYSGIIIKYKDEESADAEVRKILNVPVYLMSYPNEEYKEVAEISATMSLLLGSDKLSEQVAEVVSKAKRKEKKGKVDKFDAIIISPDDFTAILISFNS